MKQLYGKVVYRRLSAERGEETLCTLERFITEAYGKKFSLSPFKLMKRKSKAVMSGAFIESNRTFFCSELIAKTYKIMGLLEDTKASTTYFPNAFSQEKKLVMLNDAKLGPEITIL